MRLLALRGENLASLADTFEVDFEADPLRGSGIFAITGPTGAGKSTLLDAVCLALYDRLPRMVAVSSREGRASGQDDIAYNDVKGVLRAQSTGGFAEVDFVGQDALLYRARWQVKRARNKIDGRLQNQTMSLLDLSTGDRLGDKKTEVLALIQDKIGLTFDQFRRSVLLAQGDFDNFIKADGKERAQLLERITGTEIYSLLSKAAYERFREEDRALKELTTRQGAQLPLEEEARQVAEEAVTLALAEDQTQETQLLAQQRALDWHEQQQALQKGLTEAEKAQSSAQQAWEVATPRRAALGHSKAAFALRAEVTALQATERQCETLSARLLTTQQDEEKLRVQEANLTPQIAAGDAKAQAARRAYNDIGPELDKAKQLDTELLALNQEVEQGQKNLQTAKTELDALTDRLTRLEETQRQQESEQATLQSDLAALDGLDLLARDLPQLEKELKDFGTLTRRFAELQAQLVQQPDTEDLFAAQEGKNGRTEVLAGLTKLEGQVSETLSQNTGLALEEESGRLAAFYRDLEKLQDAARAYRKALDETSRATAEQARLQQQLAGHSQTLEKLDQDLPLAKSRLADAEAFLKRCQDSQSEQAEVLRLSLTEGEPCPVCGSQDHPLEQLGQLQDSQLAAEVARIEGLKNQQDSLVAEKLKAEAQQEADRRALSEWEARRAAAATEVQEQQALWQRHRQPSQGLSASLSQVLANLTETLTPDGPLQSAPLKEALAACADAQKEVGLRLRQRHGREELRKTLVEACRTLTDLVRLEDALDRHLSTLLPDWSDRQPDQVLLHCRNRVQTWRDGQKRQEQLSELIVTAQRDSSVLISQKTTAEEQRQSLAVALDKARLVRDSKAQDRTGVIEGRPIEEVRTEFRVASEDAAAAHEKARQELEGNLKDLAACRSRRTQIEADLTQQQAQKDLLSEDLANKLSEQGFSRAEVEAQLAQGEAWLKEEETALQALEKALSSSATLLSERQAQSARHDGSPHKPDKPLEELKVQKQALEKERKAARETLLRAQSVLRDDDARRLASQALLAEIEACQESHRIWGQMKDLIGSADGALFRNFAQSLTLDHLIAQANQHLSNIYPRYELQRVTGEGLLLQVVDHDLADELRGVHNLSGGERFLVSLALALGLASLSSGQGLQIESLFIDEGFGSLDQGSLDLALSALEGLQASGRRIGVISHVEALKERIAAKVLVTPLGNGSSQVRVEAA